MNKNNFINISVAIFVALSIIISLFPPFEFGNEKLRTLTERKHNADVVDKLPIKKFDFILGSNKKYFILSNYVFPQKFYSKDTLNYYKIRWSDKKFDFDSSSVDSFFTARRILFKDTLSEVFKRKNKKILYMFRWSNYSWESHYEWLNDTYNKYGKYYKFNDYESNEDAINYNQVKDGYNKSPKDWDYEYVEVFDSAKKYDTYNITQPVYYLLDRKLLLGELLVEYILAFFISIISGYLIQRFLLKKRP